MVGASSGIPITRPSTSIDLAIPQPKLRAAVADLATRQHVGTISWFGAFRHHGTHGAEKRTLRYDITDDVGARMNGPISEQGLTADKASPLAFQRIHEGA